MRVPQAFKGKQSSSAQYDSAIGSTKHQKGQRKFNSQNRGNGGAASMSKLSTIGTVNFRRDRKGGIEDGLLSTDYVNAEQTLGKHQYGGNINRQQFPMNVEQY